MMDKESALAAMRGLLDDVTPGQSVTVRREGGLFAFDIQRNDEPAI